jgi:transcriptional regulator with XRE-family HTH domain
MEQLDMPVTQLAKQLQVSNQTVRHWLSGRSFPGKRKTPELERALSFKLDYSEGAEPHAETVESSLQASDVETFLLINRLPAEVKVLFGRMAKAFHDYSVQPPAASNDMVVRSGIKVPRKTVAQTRTSR